MIRKGLYKIPVLLIFPIIIFSCQKDKDNESTSVKVYGTISLEVKTMHHTEAVPGLMVYLKANATEFPGEDPSLYNLQGTTDGYGFFTFEKLFLGSYYIYATGWDASWGDSVKGYIPFVLDSSTVVNNHSSTIVYVSE